MPEPYGKPPGQPGQDEDTYYMPRTDASKSVLINDIEKYNHRLKYEGTEKLPLFCWEFSYLYINSICVQICSKACKEKRSLTA